MTTKVTNVKVGSIRPKYANLKEWMKDEQNVYIGRAGIVFLDNERFPKQSSIWANPFKIDAKNSREDVLEKYRVYIKAKIEKENLYDKLRALKGKNLGCWCKPDGCHGDILVEIINSLV
jgi:hypothetical protein